MSILRPIQYYYYYYIGLPISKREYEINLIAKFMEETIDLIESFSNNKNCEDMFYKTVKENEKDGLKFNEWIKDVEIQIRSEIREFKLATFNKIDVDNLWNKLDKVGLTGVQLESKLNIWHTFYEIAKEYLSNLKDTITDAFKNNFKKALKATNIILKSILSVVPGVEPLIELKDFIEFSFEIE